MSKKTNTEREQARADLLKLLKPGATVYTILRHCSASGMSRVIDLVVIERAREKRYPLKPEGLADYKGQRDYDAEPIGYTTLERIRSVAYLAGKAMGYTFDRDRTGLKVSGCGMDMGFHLVYNLGATLWPKGTKKPHGTRNGEPDSCGGYALQHRWL